MLSPPDAEGPSGQPAEVGLHLLPGLDLFGDVAGAAIHQIEHVPARLLAGIPE